MPTAEVVLLRIVAAHGDAVAFLMPRGRAERLVHLGLGLYWPRFTFEIETEDEP